MIRSGVAGIRIDCSVGVDAKVKTDCLVGVEDWGNISTGLGLTISTVTWGLWFAILFSCSSCIETEFVAAFSVGLGSEVVDGVDLK